MRKTILLLGITLLLVNNSFSQKGTDFSLFMRSDSSKYLSEQSSESGDLYKAIGHHGPAVENEWFALRIYFDKKCAIDAYSKAKPGLELKECRWYPTPEQQADGWGADYYKVGSTVGLGGVRLWDGTEVIWLNPVSKRTAKVYKEGKASCMEMISEGVSYMDKKVDILIKVKVTPGSRYAEVEAKVLKGGPVQFVTGINYHNGNKVVKKKNMIAVWGLHPEDVAAEPVELGGAILFNPEDFEKQRDDGKQVLLISKEGKTLQTKITTANAREPEINTMDQFLKFLSE